MLYAACTPVHAVCTNSGSTLSATTIVSNIYCTSNDGSITINATNGWRDTDAGNGTGYSYAITVGPVTRPTQSSNIFASLPTGSYTLAITDCNGTTINRTAVIGGTAPAALSYSPVLYRSICANNNGVKIGPAGGRAPYTINIVSAPAGSTPIISGDTIKGLAVGTLTAQITDACGTTLGVSTTLATNYPLTNFDTRLHYGGCNGIAGDLYHVISTPYINYSLVLAGATNTSLVVDSFYTELYFNNVLMQTIAPTTVPQLNNAVGSAGMTFSGYGPGTYTMRTYAKCAGLIKTDSVTFGNRPATTPGTNTNLGGWGLANNGSARAENLRCTDWDFQYYITQNGWATGVVPPGTFINVMNPVFKIKVLSGASHVGDSAYSTNTYTYAAQINGLTYSSNPYVFEISDTCGQRDTVYFTRTVPSFTKRPTATASCDGASSVLNAYNPLFARNGSLPAVYPITYTFLSGPPIPWVTPSYPIIVVDSVGNAEALNIRLQAVTSPGTYTVAYENGCGQRDTTVWTVNCTPAIPGVITHTVTRQCGNRGNITLNNAVTNTKLAVGLISGPAGHTIPLGSILANTATTATFLNQPSGTYVFKGVLGSQTANTLQPFYTSGSGQNTTAANTTVYGFPLFRTGQTQTSFSYPGPIDTSKLRNYDTVFTVVVSTTSLSVSATESYLCADSSFAANVFTHAQGSVSPYNFEFSYSTTSNSGPWSTPVSDSLLTISPITASTPIWVRVTDVCGSTAISNSTVGQVSSATFSSCNSGIAEIVPNPYSSSFIYELRNKTTNVTTTYNYGTPITIDLNNPVNAATYRLSYKLASAGTTGCVVDFVELIASSPCDIALPLQLLSFNAGLKQDIATLYWTTANEQNTDQFIVEKSKDGRQWSAIGNVKAAGNSASERAYSLNDITLFSGDNYYRLRMMDLDGSYRFSKTQKLTYDSRRQITMLSPNPSTGHSTVSFSQALTYDATLTVTNSIGQNVYQGIVRSGTKSYDLDLSSVSKGIYLINISGGSINEKIKLVLQ